MSISQNFGNVSPSLLLDFANTKTLDNRITFTRSTPACHYDGKTTAMAEQNLFINSQDFNTWSIARATLTANTTVAPDGTTTGDTLTQTSTGIYGTPYKSVATSEAIYTQSLYVKAGTASWILLGDENSGKQAWFNVSAGTIGTVTSGTTATITSAGSGWYRCTVTYLLSATTGTFILGIADGDNSTTGTGGTTLIIWGAQLEQRSSATAYTVTTTQPITNYTPRLLTAGANQPRFDHNPTTGESLGLLIEEQRTNLVFRSVYAGGNWTGYGATLAQNYTIAPDASQTACQIFSTGFQTTRIDTGSLTGGTTYAASIWMKSNTSSNQTISLQIGDIQVQSCTVTPQWQRFVGASPPAGSGYDFIDLEGTANDISVWGAQLEQASFATSYIPTTGAAATRTADSARMTGTNFSSWFNQAEGTIYAEASSFINGTSIGRAVEIASSSSTTTMTVGFRSEQTWVEAYYLPNPYIDSYSTGGLNSKISFAYATLSAAFAIDGTTSTTSGVVYSYGQNATRLAFGSQNAASSQILNGWLKKVAYYPICITNTQLAALTS